MGNLEKWESLKRESLKTGDLLKGGGGSEPPVSRTFTPRLPPFFASLPSPSKLEGFKTRISHKAVAGRTIRRPFIINLLLYIF